MKIIGHGLTVLGVCLFMAGFTTAGRDYQLMYILGGIISLASGYLAYQHKPGYKPREVTVDDHTRLIGKFDAISNAFSREKISIESRHVSPEGRIFIWVEKHNRAVMVQNGQLGVTGYPSRPWEFRPGEVDYDEMYIVERILDNYIAAIPKV
jgi:hypothetical protein